MSSIRTPVPPVRLAILRNEMDDDHLNWIRACEAMPDQVTYDIVDLTKDDWLDRIRSGHYQGLLTQPTGWSTQFKILYDERAAILSRVLGMALFPTYTEIKLYENKKFLAYWLQATDIPHPKTHVFYNLDEAYDYISKANFPLVGKTNLGGGGSGVRILNSAEDARHYARQTLAGRGAPRTVGPKWGQRGFVVRVARKLAHPAAVIQRLKKYRTLRAEMQREVAILQEFVPHDFEWRVVRIGDSFFAHKKLKKGDKASGSLLKEYGDPPKDLLDLVRDITESRGLRSLAIDIFETPDGRYLVNEVQCIFGQSDPYQMLVEGIPGRYVHVGGRWVFEPGDFNRFECYMLRLEYFVDRLATPGKGHLPDHK